MRALDAVHGRFHGGRRARVLTRLLGELLPGDARVLDVGCGDGLLTHLVGEARPDLRVEGIDAAVRERTHVPVTVFDGRRIPFPDGSFDAVVLVDVLHHTEDPAQLLEEAFRVTRTCVVVKDHTREGFLAGTTLRLMDTLANARHGIAMPYNYWTLAQWHDAFTRLGISVDLWRGDLGLYPWPASWIFGRSLHFVARLVPREAVPGAESPRAAPRVAGRTSCSAEWEAAYRAFETPEQERAKFRRRLLALGAESWPRSARVLELFCGSGSGLDALVDLGFTRVEGVDLSPDLVAAYAGPARCTVADCRDLPFPDASRDVIVIHGGLHHTENLADLERVLREVRRVLVPGGRLCCVEPWQTPFLAGVDAVARRRLARRLSSRIDAFQTMVELEGETYARWLASPEAIRDLLVRHFSPELMRERLGKLVFRGTARPNGTSR